jgi:CBS-domain-containing membrane protein
MSTHLAAADITKAVVHGRDLERADVAMGEAAHLMLSVGLRHLPVVEGRRLVGIVDLADVCRVCLATGQYAVAARTS